MRVTSHPAVGDAARRCVEARQRLALCPPHSPHWRNLCVTAEAEWQTLWESVGNNTAAALLALRETAGIA
jgi:hypothetical protein